MKNKKLLYVIGILAIVVIGAWIYWQQHKKAIIRNSIENAVSKKTGNLYFIHYDSSSIDEVNGNASFYNVVLQSDSLQKQLMEFDTASSATIYNIHIDEVTVKGANIPALLSNTAVDARSIQIIHPVIYIINSGKKEKKDFNSNDSLAIYEKLLGKFNSIHASEIIITNGYLNFADRTGQPHTALKDISVNLANFRIDSTRNYQSIISYFIKDVVAKVKRVELKADSTQSIFTDVEYNAPGKFITLKNFQRINKEQQVTFDINNTSINNIVTDSFIIRQQLKAGELKTDGGLITLYRKQNADTLNDRIEFDNNSFDKIHLNSIDIGNTKINIYNRSKPKEAPFVLTNVTFKATGIEQLYSGTSINDLIAKSSWKLNADGFSWISDDKIYKFLIGAIEVNNANSTVHVNNFSVLPQITEEAFTKSLKYQNDLYSIDLKNIELSGVDTKRLITDKKLFAESGTLQPTLKVFNDRTVTPNPASKVGKYPQQMVQKIKFPISIKKLYAKNGYIAYKERGAISKQTGVVFFKNVNGIISNITNIKEEIAKNNMMVLNATAAFMGVSTMKTTWNLPLNSPNGAFVVTGQAAGFNAEALNAITEPLGMASIKKGRINGLNFNIRGTDLEATCASTFLYEDLKVELLKKDSNELKKKGLMSLLTNFLVKNNNPQKDGVARKDEIKEQRDITKSFFFLLWRSIFSAAKKTAQKI